MGKSGPRQYRKTTKGRFRSRLEKYVATWLTEKGIKWHYEPHTLKFMVPARNTVMCPNCGPVKGLVERQYTPDFLLRNKVYIETKGRLTAKDRMKMRAVIKQHPDKDIRMIFQRDNKIREMSKSITYTQWATLYGIPSCVWPNVPSDWLAHANLPKSREKAYREMPTEI